MQTFYIGSKIMSQYTEQNPDESYIQTEKESDISDLPSPAAAGGCERKRKNSLGFKGCKKADDAQGPKQFVLPLYTVSWVILTQL